MENKLEIEEFGKALAELEKIATKNGYTGAKVVTKLIYEHLEVLKFIYEAPSILEQLFNLGQLGKQAQERYFWGTITDERVQKVKEFFADGKRD